MFANISVHLNVYDPSTYADKCNNPYKLVSQSLTCSSILIMVVNFQSQTLEQARITNQRTCLEREVALSHNHQVVPLNRNNKKNKYYVELNYLNHHCIRKIKL